MKIQKIRSREILDSRGNPTVEVDVYGENGVMGRASVPSGASTGSNEALELRDGDKRRYGGKGVEQAVANVNGEIADALEGECLFDQIAIDRRMIELDGTPNKSRLGANAILGVSLATARAAATALGRPLYAYIGGINSYVLPVPMMNIVNGGSHSDAPIAFQEFMIRPGGRPLPARGVAHGRRDFPCLEIDPSRPRTQHGRRRRRGLCAGIPGHRRCHRDHTFGHRTGRIPSGTDIKLALDCAASEFFRDGVYDYTLFEGSKGARRTPQEQAEYLRTLISHYPIDSIEDGMSENDWKGWQLLTDLIGDRCQLVGDDLFVTNVAYLERGIREHCGNAILVKVNQIGTLTETLRAVEMAQRNGYNAIISHRSGETEDTTIADIAVATNAGQIKTGSLSRTDRLAKYNRLLRIEEELQGNAVYGYYRP